MREREGFKRLATNSNTTKKCSLNLNLAGLSTCPIPKINLVNRIKTVNIFSFVDVVYVSFLNTTYHKKSLGVWCLSKTFFRFKYSLRVGTFQNAMTKSFYNLPTSWGKGAAQSCPDTTRRHRITNSFELILTSSLSGPRSFL